MSAASIEVLDLNALVRPIARVKLFDGEYDVMPASGRAAELLDQIAQHVQLPAEQRPAISISAIQREIVTECVPSLPDDVYAKLNVDQINAITSIATRMQERVRAMIDDKEKNVGGP